MTAARTAHDADGILHLIALADDVTGWKVNLDGQAVRQDPDGFRNDPTGRYHGRPSWCIDGGRWQLLIDGEPVLVDSTSPMQSHSAKTGG